MVSCLSIQPYHVNSSLNLVKKKCFEFANPGDFFYVLKLVSCSRTKPRVINSIYRELINKYLKFYGSALSQLLKTVTVVLKVLPSFRDFFSYRLTEIELCYFFSCLFLFEQNSSRV